MKTIDKQETKIVAAFVAVIFVLLFSSCSSYRNGFMKTPDQPANISPGTLDYLQQKKEILQTESTQIVSILNMIRIDDEAVPPALMNRLFENIHQHYQVDSIYHQLFCFAPIDSIKMLAHEKLIESAANYHQLFQNNKNLRRMINRGDPAFHVGKKTLLHSQKFLWNPANRELLKKIIPDKPIRQSKCRFLCQKSTDNSNASMYKTFGFLSEIFGRSIAQIHNKPEPEKNVNRLMPHLQKWDIILQKSPGRMTDNFIPGYFGHAAIYMGNSVFVEGVQKGVTTTDPFHFAEGGSFLVIRFKNISEEKEKRIQQLVNGQIGKKYDFNFNVNSPGRLFCSELIYFVYDDILWQAKKSAWVVTISPDNIIQTALASDKFYFPLFFDEKQLIENPSPAFIESLLETEETN